MWATLLWAIGLVLVIEGLAFAFLPTRLDEILRRLAEIPPETRRLIGLGGITVGAVLVSWGASLGG